MKMAKINTTLTRKIICWIILILCFASCAIRQTYKRPARSIDSLYRNASSTEATRNATDVTRTATDTTTIADIPWNAMFSDTVLQGLIREGLSNNYDVKASIARIEQAQASFRQSKAAFYPTLSANAQAAYQSLSISQGGALSQSNQSYQLGGSSSWEVDIWGKLKGAKKAALANLLASDASKRAVQTELIASIATNYYNLLSLDKQVAITMQTVEVRKEDVETNKALKEGAKVTSAAIMQSEANRYAAEVLLPDLLNNIRQTENAICVLLGRHPGLIKRTTLDAQVPYGSLQTGIPAQLLSNRPDVQAAEFNLRFYFEQTNIARAYFYPTLTITAAGGWQNTSVSELFNAVSLFGNIIGGLTQPIFNQGLNRQRLEIAKAQYDENLAVFQKTVLSAGQEVSDALYSYQSALDKENIRVKQLSFLQKSVDYTRELLKYGYATYTDVLTSEQNLLTTQLSGINDKLQELTAVVTLYRSLGGGWK